MSYEDGAAKRQRAGSISGRLRTASDLEQSGLIDSAQKGVLKDMIISGDAALQGAMEKYERGDATELEAIIKSGTLSDRRSSIDLLDGLDLDFLGHSFGDSFDGFEFDKDHMEEPSHAPPPPSLGPLGSTEGEVPLVTAMHPVIPPSHVAQAVNSGHMISHTSNLSGPMGPQAPPDKPFRHRGEGGGERLRSASTTSMNMWSDGASGSTVAVKSETAKHPPPSSRSTSSSSSGHVNTLTSQPQPQSQAQASGVNPAAAVGYDPLFSSDITYEEQRLRAGSFHTDQQRARANSLMMDQFMWQRNHQNNSGYFQTYQPEGFVQGNTDADIYGVGGGNNSFTFGASPDIDYGMGIYEQRLRGNSFQQANADPQRMRAGSFQMYPPHQQQQHYGGGRGMPPPASALRQAPPSGPGDKRALSTGPRTSSPPGPSSASSGKPPERPEALAGYIGNYSPEARKERIQRFMEKRKNRVWTKKVKYDVRKNFADSRIRIKGRFVKKEDEEKMRLELGEEEWARLVAKSQGA